ncbi:MAG TPA: peptidoglycan-binding domain-containing protein [Mycobacteriales bacterium]|jgi:hypothetical protein|nr:peptidoglycan-binding domain-containing protein [Mycobacteriales bacterium]
MSDTATNELALWTEESVDVHLEDSAKALLVAVRAGRNKDFDRLVFEFDGPPPGHRVAYVPELFQDGSGNPIPLRGEAVLQVTLQPASGRRDDGTPTHPGTVPDVRNFAAFRQVADAGDFEAVLTWGVGVAARTQIRVLHLTGPSRVAVDVLHTPPGTGSELLRRGSRGAAVATWQWRLVQALQGNLEVDGDFGPATEAATRQFQRGAGLSQDGIVGRRSREAMVRALGL